jgi:class 3 adenylate cyclase
LDGERKTVTVLFAEIRGSTELMEDLDPEDAQRIVDPALKLMVDAVRRYDGYIPQSTGDGIFAVFGAPRFRRIMVGMANFVSRTQARTAA